MGGANLVWVEQSWSGWSKVGVGGEGVGRTVCRVADNLEKTLLCKFLFTWAKFFKLDTPCFHVRDSLWDSYLAISLEFYTNSLLLISGNSEPHYIEIRYE